MLKEFFDFSYAFTRSERRLLFAFIAIYALFAINIVPVDIPMGLALVVFAIAPVHVAFYLFSFYVLFEQVSVFSFGVTLNLLVQLILVVKVFSTLIKRKRILSIPGGKLKLVFLLYFILYGLMSFVAGGGFTGISIALRLFISFYVLYFFLQEEQRRTFWKAVFHIMYIATLISVLYGIFNGTSVERYISGLETSYAMQLYGSLGTTRLGMFTVSSMIYSMYFVENKRLSILLTGVMVVLTFLTVSMTAIAAMLIFFFLYFLSLGKIGHMLKYAFICMFLLIATYGIWSKLSFVQPILYRLEFAQTAIESSEINKLTSNREVLGEMYMTNFNNRDVVSKFIGVFNASGLDETIGTFSHNSYIDILGYSGIIGIIMILIYCFKNIMLYHKSNLFYPIMTLKIIMLVPAYTVSVFNSLYWTWFIFL